MKKFICIISILCMLLCTVGCKPLNTEQVAIDGKLHIYYLDVGNADSIFIKLPDGKTMLIDAGEKESGGKIVNYLKNAGVQSIDYLVATHPHADHIGGMVDVINAFEIRNVYMTNAVNNTKTFENMLIALDAEGCPVTQAKAGVEILSDDNLSAVFVAPNSDEYEDLNNYSAVIKLTYGNNSFVFAGDAEKKAEDEIRTNIKCDVLKVGHHGSNTSTTKNFLKKTEPTYAIISCAQENDYNHPHDKVLKRLEEAGVIVYRTDINGTIEVVSDGNNIEIHTER
ncbi:MAG: MBL fold metallo-hydrolase [Clostridia bacterium]|nr:MBL fold metallo-hydrolase [Clostridia bacterium]